GHPSRSGKPRAIMSIVFPQIATARATAHDALESDLRVLDGHKHTWLKLPLEKKIALLQQVKAETAKVAERWVEAALGPKQIPPGSPLAGEEWTSGPWALIYGLNQYIKTLGEIAKHGRLAIDKSKVSRAKNGQVVVDVFPSSLYDRLLLSGVRAEVW